MTGKLSRRSTLANRVNLTLLAWVALGAGAVFAVWATRPLWGSLWHSLGDWWAAVPAVAALAAATALFSLRDRRERADLTPSTEPETLRSLTSRSIALSAVALLTLGLVAATLLLKTSSGPGAAERLDAIKTAATLVAGTGGAAALLLAARRQRSAELTLLHQQRVSQAAEHDAAERRLTELYLKAVEQLGSPHAAVRHGGLYALERVAQDNPHQRQTVVNVICAYLRSPDASPMDGPDRRRLGIKRPGAVSRAVPQERHQEREVRLTAQSILQDHLHVDSDRFWPDIDLDFTGATLIGLDLADCRLQTAKFTDTNLVGDTDFRRAVFAGKVSFTGARFTGRASFNDAHFMDESRFDRSVVHGYTTFTKATFSGRTWFIGATFTKFAWFDQSTFEKGGNFWKVHFKEQLALKEVKFGDDANFAECTFAGSASFTDTEFSGAEFRKSAFMSTATFTNTSFNGYTWFAGAKFLSFTEFSKTRFTVRPEFEDVTFASRRPAELTDYLASPPPA
ncbi:pentapeptide repeat-containing protein [Amycolatopsis sp. NPDC051128]|uniref:pentapeptide repeat-containing protein n=1 Tax=Amycolatopsis sp. NPDC051128 TaxID=3155412 RepID=UPI0034130167